MSKAAPIGKALLAMVPVLYGAMQAARYVWPEWDAVLAGLNNG